MVKGELRIENCASPRSEIGRSCPRPVQTRKSRSVRVTSAYPSRADVGPRTRYVRFVPGRSGKAAWGSVERSMIWIANLLVALVVVLHLYFAGDVSPDQTARPQDLSQYP